MPPQSLPPAPSLIAYGYLPQAAGAGGTQIQTVRGCAAISAGTGSRQITLNPPNDGLTDADLLLILSLGFGTSTGDMAISASTISSGVFFVDTWRAGVRADLNSYFQVYKMPRNFYYTAV
jgi:hypothetical protein